MTLSGFSMALAGCTDSAWLSPGPPAPTLGELPSGFHVGVNLPWRGYGRDFGASAWGHDGVSVNAAALDAQLGALGEADVAIVRWFVLCDGRSGVRFGEDGLPEGLAPEVFDDLGVAVDLAEDHGVMLVPVLLDFLWFAPAEVVDGVQLGGHAGVVASSDGRAALVDRVFTPLLVEFGQRSGIVAWDIVNEPDWAIEGVGGGWLGDGVSLEAMHDLVSAATQAVHTETGQLATVGGASLLSAGSLWSDAGIDFVQVHAYEGLATQTEASLVGAGLPVVVGELGTSADHGDLGANTDALEGLGYRGVWPWSLNADDEASELGVEELAALAERHARARRGRPVR
jgi:hypothetical protein